MSYVKESCLLICIIIPYFFLLQNRKYVLIFSLVANRCVPTVIDIVDQAENVFNFSSISDLEDLARSNMTQSYSFEDLALNITLQDVVDGTL